MYSDIFLSGSVHTRTHTHTHTHTIHILTRYYTRVDNSIKLSLIGHGGGITSVQWSEGDQWLLTCSSEKMARVWSKERKDPVLTINTVKHNFISGQKRDTVCLSLHKTSLHCHCRPTRHSTRKLLMHSSSTWISSSS